MHNTVKQRIKIVSVCLLAFFPCILLRLFHVQVLEHSAYAQEATKNLESYRSITPKRGSILDRNEVVLASTAPSYNIVLQPGKLQECALKNLSELISAPIEEISSKVEACTAKCERQVHQKIAAALRLPFEEYWKAWESCGQDRKKMGAHIASQYERSPREFDKIYKRYRNDYYSRTYPLYKNIDHETAMKLELEKSTWVFDAPDRAKICDRFPGIEIADEARRRYPKEKSLSQVLGQVGPISREEYEAYALAKDYRLNDTIGKSGLELVHEDELRGRRGCSVESRDGEDFTDPPRDGMELVLTIDYGAQKVAEDALDWMIAKTPTAKGGAAVVIDVETGDVVVLASSPRYDNSAIDYDELIQDPMRPLENRAIQNSYPPCPGSVFKIMVAIYGLFHGFIDEHDLVDCRGYLHRPGSFRCTHKHGSVNIVAAIEGSCNIYFYKLGEKIGPDGLADCARLFGFGESCRIGLPGEQKGVIPTPKWKQTVLHEEWYPGDSRMFGIGQQILVTPLQVARAMAMVANRGYMPGVRLVKEIRPTACFPEKAFPDSDKSLVGLHCEVRNWSIPDHYWDLVFEGMRLVVEGVHGTARELWRRLLVRIASKTGTAQVGGSRPDHAWFAGFAPLEEPRYAFAVFIEHGGYGGSIAGPVAVEIVNCLCAPEAFGTGSIK